MIVVFALWLAPILSGIVLYANKDQLDHAAVKKKIGAFYDNFNAKKSSAMSYPIIFLVRRILFVLTTYFLMDQPGLQIAAMQYTCVLYICYIVQMPFYESIV